MKHIAILFTLFIVVVVVLADAGKLPPYLKNIYDFPYGDKLGHFVLYGLLNFFITLATIRSLPARPPKWLALSIGLTLALLIALEEFSQRYFAKRTFDLIDLLAGYLGLMVGGFVAYKLKK
jgi:polysaccharide biosynthesis protein VpsQ